MANFSTSDKNSKVTFDNDFQKFKKTKRLQRSVCDMGIPRVKVVNPNEGWMGTEYYIDGRTEV